jgi:hypothetical protein
MKRAVRSHISGCLCPLCRRLARRMAFDEARAAGRRPSDGEPSCVHGSAHRAVPEVVPGAQDGGHSATTVGSPAAADLRQQPRGGRIRWPYFVFGRARAGGAPDVPARSQPRHPGGATVDAPATHADHAVSSGIRRVSAGHSTRPESRRHAGCRRRIPRGSRAARRLLSRGCRGPAPGGLARGE